MHWVGYLASKRNYQYAKKNKRKFNTKQKTTLNEDTIEEVDGYVDMQTHFSPISPVPYLFKAMHYNRNILNREYSEEELASMGYSKLGENEDKFHQNNQKNGRNRKYVIGDWFSSEIVFYADGQVNNTPEDMGTLNVYYGKCWFGKYVIHGIYDVIPYLLWGNSPDDSTTILDRIFMMG